MDCPAENTWLRYLDGGDAGERAALEVHLDGCTACRMIFAGVVGGEPKYTRGALIGRYVVIDELGRGGMGVVYKAFDPELDRTIAVKLVASGHEPQRLVREAKTLAQLSHPNVVAVHDVGTIGDEVFVAMEYVAGVTLRQWLRASARTPREILGVFVAAARGLAAAHRLSIVHRDFKPENVMVEDDGRVRVLDFGLARATGIADAARAPTDAGAHHAITRSGQIAGTPPYMAPEQERGLAVDARSDQFSFGIALYEALYGERPPKGDVRPPARGGVPGRVRRALGIGLAPDPANRHASMDALIAELDTRKRTRIAVAALAVAAVVAGGAAVWMATRGAPTIDDACALAADDVARVWNPARRGELVARLGAADADRVGARIDAWTATWSARRKELCAQTMKSDRDQSQDIAQQVGCLRRRLSELDASVSVIAHTKVAEIARDADNIIARAGSPTVCDTYERGTLDDATRARWMPVVEKLVFARVSLAAGRIDEADAAARAAVTLARAQPDSDVLGATLQVQGLVAAERGQFAEAYPILLEAIRWATVAREDEIIVESWLAILLMALHGHDKDVEAAIFSAEVAASKLPADDPARCMVAARAGTIHARRGETDLAVAKVERGLACWLENTQTDYADPIADARFVLGLVHARRAEYGRAQPLLDAAVARWAAIDRAHEDLVLAHDTLGTIALLREDDAAAEHHYRKALEVARALGLPKLTGETAGHLAYVLVRGKRCADAVPLLATAREAKLAVHGERSLEVASAMLGQAICAFEAGEPARAKALLDVVKPIVDAAPAANASTVALADFTLARVLATKGSRSRAVELARGALARLEGHPFAIHRREIEAWLAAH